jgi:ferritin-like metal-binding protein YciE
MATANERLKQWLREVEAMDKNTRTMLDALARHVQSYPNERARTKRLLQETREQAAMLQNCLKRLGEDTSKDSAGQSDTAERCLSGAYMGAEAVKRAMTEVSAYNVLIASIADTAEDKEIRKVCETILQREEAMVEWLKKYVVSAAEEYLDGDRNR